MTAITPEHRDQVLAIYQSISLLISRWILPLSMVSAARISLFCAIR
ncbi:hypothetical protein [Kitasatospora aureofaciens]